MINCNLSAICLEIKLLKFKDLGGCEQVICKNQLKITGNMICLYLTIYYTLTTYMACLKLLCNSHQ